MEPVKPSGQDRWLPALLHVALCWAMLAGAVSVSGQDNTPPTIAPNPIPAQTLREDVTGTVPITVADAQTAAGSLIVTAISSDANVMANPTVSGTGASREINLVPVQNANGSVQITVTVSDGSLSTIVTFSVSVTAVNDAPSFTKGADITVGEDSGATTVDPWATAISAGPSDESGQTLSFTVVTNTQERLFSVQPAISAAGALSFTPAANAFGSASITIRLEDNGGVANGGTDRSSETSFSITVTNVNDPPSLTGAVLGTASSPLLDTASGIALFGSLSVNDLDGAGEAVTLVITPGASLGNYGRFRGGEVLTFRGTTHEVSTNLQAVLFDAIPNSVPTGTTNQFQIVLELSDAASTNRTTNTVYITASNDGPTVIPTVQPATVRDTQTVYPFQLQVDDVDSASGLFRVQMEVIDTGWGSLIPASPAVTNTRPAIQTYVRAVGFQPIPNRASTAQVVRIRFSVTDSAGATGIATNQLTIDPVNDAPQLAGLPVDILRTTDDPVRPPLSPFPNLSIVDPDESGQQQVTVTLAVDDPAMGTLSATTLTGAPGVVTEQVRAVTFRPLQRANRVVGETVTARVNVRVMDGGGLQVINDQTQIAITSVNGSPVFKNVALTQPVFIPPEDPRPFQGIAVQDDDNTNVVVTLRIDNPDKGSLTKLGGFVVTSVGVYTYTNLPARVTGALTNLGFRVNPAYPFPANAPGGTRFSLEARDSIGNLALTNLSFVLQSEPRNHLVTRTADDGAPGSLRYALAVAGNNDVVTFALDRYPAVVRLTNAITLTRNVAILGPGADLLSLNGDSDGDGTPDTRLFNVQAAVLIQGVTLTRGGAAVDGVKEISGGALYVGSLGRLGLRFCAITDSEAPQWGGGLDVDRGSLEVESCLFRGNRTSDGSGLGGGAVSLYTSLACGFANSTFSNNGQECGAGFGGGALYAENLTPITDLNVVVSQCTFAENTDAAGGGSSVFANAFGTRMLLRSCLFADGNGRNLDVAGSASILSEGGNVSDDATTTTLTQGGQPRSILLLDHPEDRTSTDALLAPFDATLRPLAGYPLRPGSPAIGRAMIPASAIDQRGAFRDPDPDSGALESGARQRLVLNEVHFDPATNETDFIEIYVPRDSVPVNAGGFLVRVDGADRFEFPAGYTIQPGRGVVLAGAAMTAGSASQPTPVLTNLLGGGGLNLGPRGRVELVRADRAALIDVPYVGAFVDPADPTNRATFAKQAITLAPQFRGSAYVPHKLVSMLPAPFGGASQANTNAGRNVSPGLDAGGTAFGATNALPVALPDTWVVGEDELSVLPLLANDFDADGSDRLVIVNLSLTNSPAGSTNGVNSLISAQGAQVSVQGDGTGLAYDPRVSTATNGLQSMALGERRSETVYYSILDYGVGTVADYQGTNGMAPTRIVSPAHRLNTGEEIVISGAGVSTYNTNAVVTRIDDDTFSVGIPFAGSPVEKGTWVTVRPRLDTQRSEASVTVTVLGANDLPRPVEDVVSTDEETVLRILADPALLGTSNLVFPSDALYPQPRALAAVSLLGPGNDDDPDTDDEPLTLHVVGVVGATNAITSFDGIAGESPVTVTSSSHGLTNGTQVLVTGYAGHPSYNGFHQVTVVDANTFTIPVLFVDHTAGQAAAWCRLDQASRLETRTEMGAAARLEIRADRAQTCIVYNPRVSSVLNATAAGESRLDGFFYAVEDRHGAISLGRVTVTVRGINDTPVAGNDPSSLAQLTPLLSGSSGSLPELLARLEVPYYVPAASGLADRVDAPVRTSNTVGVTTVPLRDLWATWEDRIISIPAVDLTANDRDADTSDRLQIAAAGPLSREGASIGLVTNGATVEVIYDPTGSTALNRLAREELRMDSFQITVSDGKGGRFTNDVALLVIGVNDQPVAFDDAVATREDTAVALEPLRTPAGDPTRHDFDPDIDGRLPDNRLVLAPITNVLTTAGAQVSIAGETLTYDPRGSAFLNALGPGQSYMDSYEYTATDGSLVFANNDFFRVLADGADYRLTVLANDRNLAGTGGALRIIGVGTPDRGGLATVQSDGQVLYTPPVNLVDDELFTYTISDESGNQDTAVVRVRATQTVVNGNLQASPDHFSVAGGEAALLDVLANDHVLPEGGVTLTLTRIVTGPDRGGSAVVENGRIRFTSAPLVGADAAPYLESFTYEVSGGGTARARATVSLWIIQRSNALTVGDDVFSVAEGTGNNVLDILLNDAILPGSSVGLRIRSFSAASPLRGQLALNADATALIYDAPAGFVGEESVEYVVSDGAGGTGRGRVTVRVGEVTALPDYFAVAVGPNAAATELDVLANDGSSGGTPGTDLRLTELVARSVNPPAGMLAINSTGNRISYFASNAVAGEYEYRYSTSDGSGRTASAHLVVRVVEAGLEANTDVFSVAVDSALNLLDVLRNDAAIPAEGRVLKIASVGRGLEGPNRGGAVVVTGSGDRLVYTPASGFVGEETFTYTTTDAVRTDTARVVVRVGTGELSANADRFFVYYEPSTPGGAAQSFSLPVLANDRLRGRPNQFLVVATAGLDAAQLTNAPAQGGLVTVADDRGTVVYRPQDATGPFPYTERVAYEITDGGTRRAAGVVEVVVLKRAGVPEAIPSEDAFAVALGSQNNVLPVTRNDGVRPATAAGWILTSVSTPVFGGAAQINGRTNVIYTPQPGFLGTDRFSYTISDGLGGSGTAEVRVKVGDLVLSEDQFTVLSGSSSNLLDVLANDGLRPESASGFRLVGASGADRGGTVSVEGGRLYFAPDLNYQGDYPYVEAFHYEVEDDSALRATNRVEVSVYRAGSDRDKAVVRFNVQGVNDLPTVAGAAAAGSITDKETSRPFPGVTIGEVDDQGTQPLTVTVAIEEARGWFSELAGFVETGAGEYQLTGTAPEVTAALRALIYDPIENRIPVPSSERTTFSIRVTDGFVSSPVLDTNTVLVVSAVNDASEIRGTRADQLVYRMGAVKPFSGVTILDVDDLGRQPVVVTVALDAATKGTLLNLGGFQSLGGGVYRLGRSGAGVTPAEASAALRALVFRPTSGNRVGPGASEITRFTVTVEDGFGAPVVDAKTSVLALHEYLSQVTASDGRTGDLFGSSVGASASVVVVGAPQADPRGTGSGAAYLYLQAPDALSPWVEAQRLVPADGGNGDEFGNAVAVSGHTIAVAARFGGRSPSSGVVYLFERDSAGASVWNQVKRLVPPDGAAGDEFGSAVSLDRDLLVVGARADDDAGRSSGSAYLYGRNQGGANNWGLIRKLSAGDAAAGDEFGVSVGVQGDTVVVGAHLDVQAGVATGSAYVFERSAGGAEAWGQRKKLLPLDGLASDGFGYSVGVHGDTVVVGAPRHDHAGNDRGSVYGFRRDQGGAGNWGSTGEVRSPTALNNDQFGYTVSIDRGLWVAGLPFSGLDNQSKYGTAFAYRLDETATEGWQVLQQLNRPNAANNDLFGIAVDMGQGTVAVGASNDDDRGNESGSVHLYRLAWNNPPVVLSNIPDQSVPVGGSFEWQVPSDLFGDPDPDDVLTLGASSVGGLALPSWLSFDPVTRTFRGTAVPSGSYRFLLTATDEAGAAVSTSFTVRAGTAAGALGPGGNAFDERTLRLRMLSDPESGDLVVLFARRTGAAGPAYIIEMSVDLSHWVAATADLLSETVMPMDLSLEQVVLRIRKDPLATHGRFFRIRLLE